MLYVSMTSSSVRDVKVSEVSQSNDPGHGALAVHSSGQWVGCNSLPLPLIAHSVLLSTAAPSGRIERVRVLTFGCQEATPT